MTKSASDPHSRFRFACSVGLSFSATPQLQKANFDQVIVQAPASAVDHDCVIPVASYVELLLGSLALEIVRDQL